MRRMRKRCRPNQICGPQNKIRFINLIGHEVGRRCRAAQIPVCDGVTNEPLLSVIRKSTNPYIIISLAATEKSRPILVVHRESGAGRARHSVRAADC